MDLKNDAAAGGSEATPIAIAPAPAGEMPLGAREAARNLASWRHNRDKKDQAGEPQVVPPPDPAYPRSEAVTMELADQANAGEPAGRDPGLAPPSETDSADREADLSADASAKAEPSPIEPPRSWTKEDKELFTSLPRETQERIAERERSREGDFSRRQQEATERAKALEAERLVAEWTRQHYESALPQLLTTLQNQQAGEFADIKTLADVERLAREDWPRYALWDMQQRKIAFATEQLLAAQGRQALERQQRFSEFASRQDDLFREKVPDMADAKKAAELEKAAVAVLKDLGFDEAELAQAWQGQKDLSLRDHRVLLLIRDAILWRDAQQKARAATAKPVPPVQRPGVSQSKGAAHDAQIQNLTKRLDQSGSLKDAAALLRAKRTAR